MNAVKDLPENSPGSQRPEKTNAVVLQVTGLFFGDGVLLMQKFSQSSELVFLPAGLEFGFLAHAFLFLKQVWGDEKSQYSDDNPRQKFKLIL